MARMNRDSDDYLPRFRYYQGTRSFSKKWVHFIPVIVIACMFLLWVLSSHVDLKIEDGIVTEVAIPISLNETRVDIALLAAASPPYYASVTHMETVEESQAAGAPANWN